MDHESSSAVPPQLHWLWIAANEDVITLNISHSISGNQVEEGMSCGIVPFSSILIMVNVLRSNIAINPFKDKLLWPLQDLLH